MSPSKRSRLSAAGGFFAVALALSPAWGSTPPKPGTINYVEGHASLGGQPLGDKSVGAARLAASQLLSTDDGRVEILLTPGIFVRVDDHSSVQMISPGLADTVLSIEKGRAMVEVAEILPANNVRINEGGESTRLLKAGLYDFDADRSQIRVFDGKAVVQTSGQRIQMKGGRLLNLNVAGKLRAQRFDKGANADDFYRWASLRSSYLAEANVDAARTYGGFGGWSPGVWSGSGWYWAPAYDAYTFIPDDGVFFDPFGWGFYSPWCAYEAPYFGYGMFGYGGYGYGYGYGPGRRRFGPGYRPPFMAGNRGLGSVGHAHSVRGGTIGGFSDRGAFRGGGFGSSGGRAIQSGGGFSRGGFGGGGFHGGGGMRGGGGGGRGR